MKNTPKNAVKTLKQPGLVWATFVLLPFLGYASVSAAFETSGKVGIDGAYFFDEKQYADQHFFYPSAFIEHDFAHETGEESEIKAKLFLRVNPYLENQVHTDVRELMWYQYADEWEVHAGIGKEFWGTTESRHLVDVINQIDQTETLNQEARLGQAMLQGKLIKEWGTLDVFTLPFFRQVEYGGIHTRPHLPLLVDSDKAIYQSDDKENNIDFATRWSHSIGDADIAISYFNGTQRAPLLSQTIISGKPVLIPTYVQTQQLSVDALYIAGDITYKLEALQRFSHDANLKSKDTFAYVAGLESTLVGVFDSVYDLGILAEYLHDNWKETTPFQDDIMLGLRLVLNDEQSTDLLLGTIIDTQDQTTLVQLTSSRRLGDNWKAELAGRWALNVDPKNTLHAFKQDNQLSLKINYYY